MIRKSTKLIIPSIGVKVPNRTMLSRAAQAAKISSEIAPVVLQTTPRTYASYAVNNLATPKDEGHPPIAKQSCASEACNTSNCVNDNSKCDNETQTTAIVGHLTHSEKGVTEKDREVHKIDEEHLAVIYDTESQQIDHIYTEMRYAETKIVQQEDATNVLNNATKNINKVDENKNENDLD